MLFLRLWNYIKGYVIIMVEGCYLEKFINICAHRQILLWNIKKKKECLMTLNISAKGFKKLRPIVKKTGCKAKMIRKRGLPFILNRYKRRKAFVLGAGVFVLLIYFLTSFIWIVEITGNKELDSQFIIDKLACIDIKPGILKYNVDPDKVVRNMMLEIKELAWIGVTVKGTKVKVQVVERKQPPELIPTHIPCDIIARRDGIIKSIFVKEGQETVKAGDTVTRGQVLVSGVLKNKNDEKDLRFVHAIADIKARTWYEGLCPINLIETEVIRTGRVKNNYAIVIFSKRIDIFPGKDKFENYDKIGVNKTISLGNDFVLPFALIIDKYYETDFVQKEIGLNEAKQNAANNAYLKALEGISEDARIIESILRYIENNGGRLVASVIVECIEDIGITKEIGVE